LDRIFERFERGDARSHKDGLGMGLWITKQIVQAHGGTVNVRSELGKGSTFMVRFRFADSEVSSGFERR
jgi:signal transduction histidine kinase